VNKRASILLMDEDAETLEQLQTVLQRERYQVLAAVDGHAALRLVKTAKPDLVVSDLLLASLDGYEVWKILRRDKETAHIPILVTSAFTVPPCNEPWRPTPDAPWQILSYDAFLPKPIDLRQFTRVVEKLLLPDTASTIPSGPSVILATKDKTTQNDLVTILRNHDFGVKTADSLDNAIRLVRAVPPAALILDYRIPDEAIKTTVLQVNKLVPNTVIILLIDPKKEFDIELQTHCDGFLSPPLHPVHTIANLNHILELYNMRRRTQALSTQLIITDRNLRDIQQMLNAQNKELKYINARLRELDSLKEMFRSMVVHDLKSPLGAVLGALNFLLTDPDSSHKANADLLTGAVAAGNQMLRLIETLLERQRLEDGVLKPDAEPFDFSTIIDVSLKQMSSLLTLHHLKIERIVADDLPPVYADPDISQRILENLLDNAIKFSPRNGTITVKAAPDNDIIKVSVADEGSGIPKDQQRKVFDRFTQLDNVAKSSGRSGFGLGLTFCHLAAQAMNGSIWVESDGASGTTFLFTLPIYNED
jgi:signal transduction histidine kinase